MKQNVSIGQANNFINKTRSHKLWKCTRHWNKSTKFINLNKRKVNMCIIYTYIYKWNGRPYRLKNFAYSLENVNVKSKTLLSNVPSESHQFRKCTRVVCFIILVLLDSVFHSSSNLISRAFQWFCVVCVCVCCYKNTYTYRNTLRIIVVVVFVFEATDAILLLYDMCCLLFDINTEVTSAISLKRSGNFTYSRHYLINCWRYSFTISSKLEDKQFWFRRQPPLDTPYNLNTNAIFG